MYLLQLPPLRFHLSGSEPRPFHHVNLSQDHHHRRLLMLQLVLEPCLLLLQLLEEGLMLQKWSVRKATVLQEDDHQEEQGRLHLPYVDLADRVLVLPRLPQQSLLH